MNVLFVSRCPPYPLYLGDRLILHHLTRRLAQRGHTLDLYALADRADDWREMEQYAGDFRHVRLFEMPRRTPLAYLRRQLVASQRFPRQAAAAWSPALWDSVRHAVAAGDYDVAHVFGGVQVYEVAHALDGVPKLITPYDSYSLYLKQALGSAGAVGQLALWGQYQVARALESWMFSPYARAVFVAPKDAAELRAANPAVQTEVIPNGVDLAQFQPADEARQRATLLFVGNYEYPPNVAAAVRLARDVFPRVRARLPEAQLWLVGSSPPPAVAVLASATVTVTGRVPAVQPYLASASVFVSALRGGSGIKNKVLEALAMGCPVVATPISVDGIAAEDGEHVLLAESDAALADAAVRVLTDAALAARLSANGRRLVEGVYDWELVTRAYLDLYAQVIGVA